MRRKILSSKTLREVKRDEIIYMMGEIVTAQSDGSEKIEWVTQICPVTPFGDDNGVHCVHSNFADAENEFKRLLTQEIG